MHYLLTYPYGCIEQTSSGVLALAALRGVVQDNQVPGITLPEVDKYLNRGVGRILGMQTDNGGFAYWPGQSEPHGWGSIYAGAALSMAKKNGLEVPEEPLTKAPEYFHEPVARSPRPPYAAKAFAAYILALNQPWSGTTFKGLRQNYARSTGRANCCCSWRPGKPTCGPWRNCRRNLKPLLGPDIAKETSLEPG